MASNLDIMKMVFDPKMEMILQSVRKKPKTVKEIAGELDEKPSRLYYPVQKLLSTGLLSVQEEKQVGNLIEKHYTSKHLFGADDVMQVEGELASRNIDFLLPMIMMSVNKGVQLLKEDLENPKQTYSRAMYTETSANLTNDEWVKVNDAIRQIISERSGTPDADTKEYTFSLLTYEKAPKVAE